MTELNDAVTIQELRNRIDAKKSGIKKKYNMCRSAATKLVAAHDKYMQEGEKSTKKLAKYAALENKYTVAKEEFLALLSQYDAHVAETKQLYASYISNLGTKHARKLHSETNKFIKSQSNMREKILSPIEYIMNSDESFELAAAEDQRASLQTQPQLRYERELAEPQPQQLHQSHCAAYASQNVNVAPMSIDISHIVEEAVSLAMDKFKEAFEKRAGVYISELPKSEAQIAATHSDGGEMILKTEEKLLDDERTIIEKLESLSENLNKLLGEVAELGAAYIELEGKHKDAVEAQRRINDMQRSIAREIQGVQANQKVISQEQAALSSEQAVIIEHQKANSENQKIISDAQESLAQMQKTVVDTQATLEESMREILASQKGIITTQQSIITENLKNVEAGRVLSEKQSELTLLQKEVTAHQREVARSQKSINQKIEAQK